MVERTVRGLRLPSLLLGALIGLGGSPASATGPGECKVSVSDLGAWLLWERRGAPDPEVVSRVAASAGRLYGALGDVRVSELLSNTGVQVSLVRGPRKAVRHLSGRYDELYDRSWDAAERRNLVEAEPGDELIASLDRYEAIRRCTRRAQIMPIRGVTARRAAAK